MSPKFLPDYLTIEGEITTSFHSYAYIPQSLAGSIEGKNIGRIFFGEDELDYAALYRLADQFQFNSNRFASDQAIEVYLRRSPQSPTASRTLSSS